MIIRKRFKLVLESLESPIDLLDLINNRMIAQDLLTLIADNGQIIVAQMLGITQSKLSAIKLVLEKIVDRKVYMTYIEVDSYYNGIDAFIVKGIETHYPEIVEDLILNIQVFKFAPYQLDKYFNEFLETKQWLDETGKCIKLDKALSPLIIDALKAVSTKWIK